MLSHRPIITLLTDFGVHDAYVGAMKGVILDICPDAVIIDITHHVRPFDVRQGAFLLHQAVPYFPVGTIHVAVVDPGVGTNRRRIGVRGRQGLYVGPDNGVLALALHRDGFVQGVELQEAKYMRPTLSPTFDGRDIFAPVAAHLACGVALEELGPPIARLVTPPFAQATRRKKTLVGEVLHIDRFGNLITNIPRDLLVAFKAAAGEVFRVKIDGATAKVAFSRAYGGVPEGTPVMVVGSSDFIEVSINRGDARALFQADVGSHIEVARLPTT